MQTLPTRREDDSDSFASRHVGGGFKGSNYLGPMSNLSNPYDHSHLAMTYVALCTLIALGDDLSRINRAAILDTLKGLQKDDGSFVAISSNYLDSTDAKEVDDDCDLRFMYTAICIWYILTGEDETNGIQSDDGINIKAATNYILSCITYEGSLGLTPGREGHGGSTFCGIASLYLMGVLDDVMKSPELRGWKDDLIRWCVMRQYSHQRCDGNDNAAGIQGRPNKLEDTCYSYWIGGTLHLLGVAHLLDGWALREYVLKCQSPYGGFGKVVGTMPDLLHSFYSMAWLAISDEGGCCDSKLEDESFEENATKPYEQVADSIRQLSRLDCALGMCAKRRPAMSGAN